MVIGIVATTPASNVIANAVPTVPKGLREAIGKKTFEAAASRKKVKT
jgi:hypothetical protein